MRLSTILTIIFMMLWLFLFRIGISFGTEIPNGWIANSSKKHHYALVEGDVIVAKVWACGKKEWCWKVFSETSYDSTPYSGVEHSAVRAMLKAMHLVKYLFRT